MANTSPEHQDDQMYTCPNCGARMLASQANEHSWNCDEADDDDSEYPNDCPECERSHGPNYSGPCNH